MWKCAQHISKERARSTAEWKCGKHTPSGEAVPVCSLAGGGGNWHIGPRCGQQ